MARKTLDKTPTGPLASGLADFAGFGTQQAEAFLESQSVLTETIQASRANWLRSLQAEGMLASELGARLARARSIPDVVAAWQDWTSKYVDLATKDARRAVTDAQAVIEIARNAFTGRTINSVGWPVF